MLITKRYVFALALGMFLAAGCSGKREPAQEVVGAWKQTAIIGYESNAPVGEGKRTDSKSDWVRDFLPGGVLVSEGTDNAGEKEFQAFQFGKWTVSTEGPTLLMVDSENIYATHQAWGIAGALRFVGDAEPEMRVFLDGFDTVMTKQPGSFEPDLVGLWLEKGQTADNWQKADVFTHTGLNVTFMKEGKEATHRISRCTVESGTLRQTGVRPEGDFQRTFTIAGDELTLTQDGASTVYHRVTDMPDEMVRALTR